jgi:AraC-like DNA-binding protein
MTPYYEKSNDDLRVFNAVNLDFPAHLHSHMELIYVVSGTINVTISNKTKELNSGDFAIVFPNTLHSYASNTSESSCSILIAICSLNLTGDFFKKITSYYPTNPFISSDMLHENVPLAMLELEKERRGEINFNACSAFLHLILSRTTPLFDLVKNKETENYDLTYQIVTYVSEHFQEDLTLTELAAHLNINKYYLSRLFSTKLNTNFNKYLNYIRLNYALTLIQSSSYTLTRISIDSGFESQRTFNRAFREVFHLSPSEYRQRTNLSL